MNLVNRGWPALPLELRRWVRLVAVLGAPAFVFWTVARCAVNLPFWDDWDFVTLAVQARQGVLSWAALWSPHNEHRVLLPKLVIWVVARLTDYNLVAQLWVGIGFQVAAFVVVMALLRLDTEIVRAVPLVAGVSVLMFSMAQWENWIWPLTAVHWYLANLMAVAAVYSVKRDRGGWSGVLVGLCCAMAAVLTLGAGIATVVIVAVSTFWWGRFRIQTAAKCLVTLTAGGLLAFACVGRSLGAGGGVVASLSRPRRLVVFFLAQLGAPVSVEPSVRGSAIAGLLGLVAFTGLCVYMFIGRDRATADKAFPWLCLSLHSVLVASVISLGRSMAGAAAALAARYSSPALLFWVGLVGTVWWVWDAARDRPRKRVWPLAVVVTYLAFVTFGASCAFARGHRSLQNHSRKMQVALEDVLHYRSAGDDALAYLYRTVWRTALGAAVLEQWKLGPFAHRVEPPDPAGFQGSYEGCDCWWLFGWVWRGYEKPFVEVDILVDGAQVGRTRARWFREDLRRVGVGDGRAGFQYPVYEWMRDGKRHVVEVRIHDTGEPVGPPKSFVCPPAEGLGGVRATAGALEAVTCEEASGWAWRSEQRTPMISIWSGNVLLGRAPADTSRRDLPEAWVNAGARGFSIILKDLPSGERRGRIRAVVEGTDEILPSTGALLTDGAGCGGSTTVPGPRRASYEGILEGATCGQIFGWVFDRERPAVPLRLVVFDGATRIAATLADEFRADLLAAGKGDGRHSFSLPVPAALRDGREHVIRVGIEDDGDGSAFELPAKTLACR